MLNEKAVTARMTIVHENTSVLEMVATLKEYRRKGVATAAIDKALEQFSIKVRTCRALLMKIVFLRLRLMIMQL